MLKQIEERLDLDLQNLDSSTKTYEAVQYALNHWVKLCRYVYYPDATIDNNAAERAVRPTKLGMKNWLFIGHPQAGQRAAIIYTIIQNCKNYGVDPQAYLNDVLERLPHMKNDPEQIRRLQPKCWRKKISQLIRGKNCRLLKTLAPAMLRTDPNSLIFIYPSMGACWLRTVG